MLILSRKKNESIVVNGDITITVVELKGDKVRLGVVCPKEMSVHRQEVYEAVHGWAPPAPPPRPPEERAFLQAVLENPDDDAARLIFADWLEERGDPRGEFIRVQCMLASTPTHDPRRQALVKRERILSAEHGRLWRAFLPPVLRDAAFGRGFAEAVHLTAAEFLAHAEEMFAAAPIRRLRVLPGWGARPQEQIASLAASPYFARLAELDLSGQPLGDRAAVVLAKSPHIGSLKTLLLRSDEIGDGGAAALASSPHLAGLATLDLSGNPIGEAGARALQARFGGRVRCESRGQTTATVEAGAPPASTVGERFPAQG